jgi:hypothetical protein
MSEEEIYERAYEAFVRLSDLNRERLILGYYGTPGLRELIIKRLQEDPNP